MIDFHQHIGHAGRTVEHMLAHQDAHGVRQSVVLIRSRLAHYLGDDAIKRISYTEP